MKDPKGKPTPEELDDLSQDIPDWESLAYKLGMDRVVQGIRNNNQDHKTIENKAREMLLKWLMKGSATYGKLGVALEKLDLGGIAEKHGFSQVKIQRLLTVECFIPERVLIIEVQIRVASVSCLLLVSVAK